MARKKYIGTDVEYEVKPEKKKFKITRGKLIILSVVALFIIVLLIILLSNRKPKNKSEYSLEDFRMLEEKMVDETSTYLDQKQIELTEKKIIIKLDDLLYENGGLIKSSEYKAVNICEGYVVALKDEMTHITPYIKCEDKYISNGYDESNLEVVTTKPASKKDVVPPVITLNGDSTITIEQGDYFEDPFAVATDDVDGNITSKIKKDKDVNTSIIGTYIITYSVSDKSGNKSEVKRTVEVIEKVFTTTQRPTTTKKPTTTKYTTPTTKIYTTRPTTKVNTTTTTKQTTKWTKPITTKISTTKTPKISITPNVVDLNVGSCYTFTVLPYTSGINWQHPTFITLDVSYKTITACCKSSGTSTIKGTLGSNSATAKITCR